MTKKRSVWKNTPEGTTVRRNKTAEHWTSRPVGLLRSPAYRVLSRTAHLALSRIEIELRDHAGRDSAKLAVTKTDFIEYGIHPRMVAAAIRELEALGIIRVTARGRGGNAEHRQPNRFCLNYACGAVDAKAEVNNAWSRIETLEQAEQIAGNARSAKDPDKVAYGRRTARQPKTFSGVTKCHFPGAQSDPENPFFSGAQSDPTAQVHKVTPLSRVSGGGRAQASPKKRRRQNSKVIQFDTVRKDHRHEVTVARS